MATEKTSFHRYNIESPLTEKIAAIPSERIVTLNQPLSKGTEFHTDSSEASWRRAICKKYGISAALSILFIGCLTLVILALTGKNARAGLFTLQVGDSRNTSRERD